MDVREEGKSLSNWGRWGPDDERGTTNFITAAVVAHAATLVKKGQVIPCGVPFDENGPQTGAGGRFNPIHTMTATGADDAVGAQPFPGGFRYADDIVTMPLQCATQWDALSHVFYDGKMYNGYPSSLVTSQGAAKNSIDKQKAGIVSRGVLLDFARLRKVDWLTPGTPINPSDLDECVAAQKVEIRSGDILCIRTGAMTKYKADGDRPAFFSSEAGLTVNCARWVHDKEIACVTVDNFAVDCIPAPEEGHLLPFHMVGIRDMGLTLGEIFDFDALGDACAADGVYDFLFCAPPLPVTRAVGSPINPLAVR